MHRHNAFDREAIDDVRTPYGGAAIVSVAAPFQRRDRFVACYCRLSKAELASRPELHLRGHQIIARPKLGAPLE